MRYASLSALLLLAVVGSTTNTAWASVIVYSWPPGLPAPAPTIQTRASQSTGYYVGPGTRPSDGQEVRRVQHPGALNASGQVAFRADLFPVGENRPRRESVLLWDGEELISVVQDGDAAPTGAVSGMSVPLLNDLGQVVTIVREEREPLGPPSASALLVWDGTDSEYVARSGVPGPGGIGTVGGFQEVALADSGELAWVSFVDRPTGHRDSVYRLGESGPEALSGGLPPSFQDFAIDESGAAYRNEMRFAPSGVTPAPPVGSTNWADEVDPLQIRVDDSGGLAFSAAAYAGGTSLGTGVFRLVDGAPSAVVFRGEEVLDGWALERVEEFVLAPDGTLAFLAEVSSGGQRRDVLYMERDGLIREVISSSDEVEPGLDLASLTGRLAISSQGLVAFEGSVRTLSGNTSVLLLTDGDEVAHVLGRPGTRVDAAGMNGGPGSGLTGGRLESGQDLGGRAQVNDRGQVLVSTLDGLAVVAPDLHWRGGESGMLEDASWTLGLRPESIHALALDPAPGESVDLKGPASDARFQSLQLGTRSGGSARVELDQDVSLSFDRWLSILETGSFDQRAGIVEAPELSSRGTFAQSGGRLHVGSLASSGRVGVNGLVEVDGILENVGALIVTQSGRVHAGEFLQRAGSTQLDGGLSSADGLTRVDGGRFGGSGTIEGDLEVRGSGRLSILLEREGEDVLADLLEVSGTAWLAGGFEVFGDLSDLEDGDSFNVLLADRIQLITFGEVPSFSSGGWFFTFDVLGAAGVGQVLRMSAQFVPEPARGISFIAGLVFSLGLRRAGARAPRRRR